MRKLLVTLLALPTLSFASDLDMSTLACKNLKLTSATTLLDVQNNCVIEKQRCSKGRYEVVFVNDSTNETVTCHFATKNPSAVLNSCEG